MKFALFYERPIARPPTPGKEHQEVAHSSEAVGTHLAPEFSH